VVVVARRAAFPKVMKRRKSMSRWPLKGKFPRIAISLFIVLGCMLVFHASADGCSSSPDITNVTLNVDSDIMCEDHVFTICFHSWTGLTKEINGFWVFFEEDVEIDPDLDKECVGVKWDGYAYTTPYMVEVYDKAEFPEFAPPEANQAIKIWINESIPHNQDVCINISCGTEIPCPLDCDGFRVWVNNDIQRCPQPSCPFYMKVKVVASAGPGGTIEQIDPAGPTAPPTFNTTFNCGDTPRYRITTGDCYEIDQIIITPLCDCPGCGETITYGNGTTEAEYQFDPLHCSYSINATFKPGEYRVRAYLKYQLPKDECWGITKEEICGSCDIQSTLDCVDTYYLEHGEPFAWQLVTQDFLECNPEWEGYIGVVVEVDNGTYDEDIIVDTPGVHLKNKEGASPVIDGSVSLLAGCTGIEGFTVTNSDTNGIFIWPSSDKCVNTSIHDCELVCEEPECLLDCDKLVPCCKGRINVVGNHIYGNDDNGIRVKDAVVLINGNEIYNNGDDGIDAGCLFCGVECIDPEALTHSPACSEIIYNTIYSNGQGENGEWEVDGHFTSDPTACDELKGWTDAGIQIRCVGSEWCPCEECCECEPPCECILDDGADFVSQQEDQEPCGGCNQTLYIAHNDVYANYHAGIYLMKGATQGGNIIIQGNQLHENGIFGMLTEAELPCRIEFRCNNIWCNTYWGVKNLACCDLIAKENYWGSAGGPSAGPEPIVQCIDCRCHEPDQRSDALGNGNAVSHKVHYNPWLYDWACEDKICGSNPCGPVRIYGSDSLELQCGWNTLSVPVMLADEGDTMMEIAGLGKFITADNFIWILKWDATAKTWVDVGAGNEIITPGVGYYIKMTDDSRFPVLYNDGPSPGLTAVPVESGWNLIGAPWGIDRLKDCCADDEGRWAVASPDAGDPEAFKPVWEALESIKEGNGGTKGVAIVVSPSVPGQINIFSASVTSGFWDPIYNNKEMATGEGYWVFMVNPSTYAGFEITPFYFPSK
jgi:hypothetical protein